MTLRLLDLFSGAGGCAMGYHLAGFEVVGVDIKPQPRYPFRHIVADALTFPLDGYDVIHASPPCPRFSCLTPTSARLSHPDYLTPMLTRLRASGLPYVVENVPGSEQHMRSPIMLCGSMLGLGVWRHRFFEIGGIDLPLILTPPCNHSNVPVLISGSPRRNGSRKEPSTEERRSAGVPPGSTG